MIVNIKKNVIRNMRKKIKMEEAKGMTRVPFMITGMILFSLGILFKHPYMFIGGIFLMYFIAKVRFPDD